MKKLLSLDNLPLNTFAVGFSWEVYEGQNWLIRGDINSGKSEFLKLLTGKSFLFEDRVMNFFGDNPGYGFNNLNNHLAYLNFRGMIADHRQFYYQQRYNSTESDNVVTLRDTLFQDSPNDNDERELLVRLFGLRHCLDEEIIKLSSGEYRKASVIKAILQKPDMLVLDEPYAGLDKQSVGQMDDLLTYTTKNGTRIILSSNTGHIPAVITHVLHFEDHRVSFNAGLAEYQPVGKRTSTTNNVLPHISPGKINSFSNAFSLNDTTVRYGNRIILDGISWTVQRGEKWLLTGRNGAGKSILLSLVYADNPQAYANEIYLFDRRRGSGESIWEIKERIGYFSSEMFLYLDKMKTTTSAAFRYLTANPYNKKQASADDMNLYRELLSYFRVKEYDDMPLFTVPWEAQRIFMLINVFLGGAPLIILDEPYHGLDEGTITRMNALLDRFCEGRTLVFVSHDLCSVPNGIEKRYHLEKGRGEEVIPLR